MVQFINFPDSSRVWIYQSPRELSEDEATQIEKALKGFTAIWKAHGQLMHADASVLMRRFLILVADEQVTQASGCSIDDSVRIIKQLGEMFQIDLFNRMNVCYLMDEKLVCDPIHDFWAKRKGGIVTDDTMVFDTTIQTLGSLNHDFLVTFKKSWHSEMW